MKTHKKTTQKIKKVEQHGPHTKPVGEPRCSPSL